ncbi:MAG: HIT domain-containing protein, partial [Calditrichia bacterium]
MKTKEPKQTLWAPWRMQYILEAKEEKNDACLFCERYPQKDDKNNRILYRGKTCFVIMNRYPYNNGHLMVVPYRHSGNIGDLSKEENLEIMEVFQLCVQVLEEVMEPHGYNIGMNIGR